MELKKSMGSGYVGAQIDKVKWATVLATVLSIGALLTCVFLTRIIYNEVQGVWAELEYEMQEFKVC